MFQRRAPSRAFQLRDSHRTALTRHFLILSAGLGTAFAANRFLTPDVFWAGWLALVWGALFAAHLVVFARETLATMGARRDR